MRNLRFIQYILLWLLLVSNVHASLDCQVFANLFNFNTKIQEMTTELTRKIIQVQKHPRLESQFNFRYKELKENLDIIQELSLDLNESKLKELKADLDEIDLSYKQLVVDINNALKKAVNTASETIDSPAGTSLLKIEASAEYAKRRMTLFLYNANNGFKKFFDNASEEYQNHILRRLEKVQEEGHFGDHKKLAGHSGLFEFRFRQSLRVYYTLHNGDVVILNAGPKGTQNQDIAATARLLKDFLSKN